MRTKKFFASAAKGAFALAVAMMMSTAFTSCSKDNDDKPEPKFTNTVTLDGVEKAILKAEYDPEGDGNYRIYLVLSADEKEQVVLHINEDVFGTPIKLTEKAKKNADNRRFRQPRTVRTCLQHRYHRVCGLHQWHPQHPAEKRPREGQRRQGTHPHHQLQRQDNGVVIARAALDKQD